MQNSKHTNTTGQDYKQALHRLNSVINSIWSWKSDEPSFLQILMILSASHLCFSELLELIFIPLKRTKSNLLVSQSYKVIPLDASGSPELPSSENSDRIPGKLKLNQVKEASTKQRSLYNSVKFLCRNRSISKHRHQTINSQISSTVTCKLKWTWHQKSKNFSTFVRIYLS